MTAELVAMWAAVAATAVGAGAVFLQLRQVANRANIDYSRQKKQATIDFYVQTLEARSKFGSELPPDRKASEIKAFLLRFANEESVAEAVSGYLGYWELLAGAANEGIIDKDVVALIARTRIISIADNYGEYIARERKRIHVPGLYEELTSLAAHFKSSGSGGDRFKWP